MPRVPCTESELSVHIGGHRSREPLHILAPDIPRRRRPPAPIYLQSCSGWEEVCPHSGFPSASPPPWDPWKDATRQTREHPGPTGSPTGSTARGTGIRCRWTYSGGWAGEGARSQAVDTAQGTEGSRGGTAGRVFMLASAFRL